MMKYILFSFVCVVALGLGPLFAAEPDAGFVFDMEPRLEAAPVEGVTPAVEPMTEGLLEAAPEEGVEPGEDVLITEEPGDAPLITAEEEGGLPEIAPEPVLTELDQQLIAVLKKTGAGDWALRTIDEEVPIRYNEFMEQFSINELPMLALKVNVDWKLPLSKTEIAYNRKTNMDYEDFIMQVSDGRINQIRKVSYWVNTEKRISIIKSITVY